MHPNNTRNRFVEQLGDDLLDACPKTVLAAIAVHMSNESDIEPRERVLNAWDILHKSGVVKQKPPKKLQEAQGTIKELTRVA